MRFQNSTFVKELLEGIDVFSSHMIRTSELCFGGLLGHHCPGLRLSGIFLKIISVRERANALKKRGLKKVGFRVFSSHQKDEGESTEVGYVC